MVLSIYIEDKKLDLFDDEVIELNSSVANTEDISKINTDYTKTFTVPASDNNNAIFRHYYNADIDNTFDARTKKKARIELSGITFRTGKMRLEKVIVKGNMPSSYTITFWGTLINFKNLIKDDELNSLDLTEFDHPYNYDNVREGLTTGLFSRNIIYTLMNQRRQYMYSSDEDDNTDSEKLVNIAYNGEDRGVRWNELKPAIRLISIIEAIEAKYGFTFSRDFFGRTEFNMMFLWLNSTTDTNYTTQEINWTSGTATEFGLNLTTNEWVVNSYGAYSNMRYILTIVPQAGYEGVPYRIIGTNNGAIYSQTDATGEFSTPLTPAPDPPFNFKFYVSASESFQYDAHLLIRADHPLGHEDRAAFSDVTTILDVFDIAPALPKMKIVDFLKGLFNMFKLVAIPDEQGNVYVNNIDDYYREGTVYDITKWVDFEAYDVERGKIFNTINFKYEDPTTILNMEFLRSTGLAYGDEKLELADEEGEPLDGEALEISLPFEIVLFERLIDIHTNSYTNIQYGLITTEALEPANPKAVLFFNNPVSLGDYPISILDEPGTTHELVGVINTPAHTLGFDNPSFSILWGSEYSTWNGVEITNTLFKNYWSSYIASIFNIKKRNFKFKAQLPTPLITKLRLNDVLYIKNRYYRINDFTMDLVTGATSLRLMNTFENNFGLFAPDQRNVYLSSMEQTYGVYVTNSATMNITKVDTGYSVGWATVSKVGSNLMIAVTENTTGTGRAMRLDVNNGAGRSFQIFLTQAE